jgi:hypothetical protein
MIIRVLPQLESREEWLVFCRRETPYCLIDQPSCLVDFQTHFLQLTLFETVPEVRYTLGSRRTMEPAWQLIKGCNWSLTRLIEGLASLDFGSNVRDNGLLGLGGDLSARRSFPRDRHLHSPASSRLLPPLKQLPQQWNSHTLSCLLANEQFRDWRDEQEEASLSAAGILLDMLDQPEQWSGRPFGPRLQLFYRNQVLTSLIPALDRQPSEPTRRGLLAAPPR